MYKYLYKFEQFIKELFPKEWNNKTMYKCQKKKTLINHQNCLTAAYKQTRCEACVEVSKVNNENNILYQTNPTK